VIYQGMYGFKGNKCLYEPPAGPTIKEAIANAIEIAKYENKEVEFHINDFVINVRPNSEPASIAAIYFDKLEKRNKRAYNAAYHKNLVR
jgi:hypothetical protein